jgi:hypothetical protein
MTFDFDAFAGALHTLSRALDKAAETTGIPRGALTNALHHRAVVRRNKSDATFWKSAHSDTEIGKWIWRERRKFDGKDETEILELSREIPARIRRDLIEIAKSIPAARGGKRPALDLTGKWQVQKEVRELHAKGLSKDRAYETVAKRMGVSAHTVRRYCDKRERERSRGRTVRNV